MVRITLIAILVMVLCPLTSCGQVDQDLIEAAKKGDTAAVETLLAKGVKVNARQNDGSTALMVAAFTRHIDALQALLDAGADVNARDNSGLTPLMKAKERGHTDIVNMLLAAGAKK